MGESSSSSSTTATTMASGRIERKSSIESEPRTLDMKQMKFARDAALYVLNTSSTEEALRIFTQGLEPVSRAAHQQNGSMITTTSDVDVVDHHLHLEEKEEEEEEDDQLEYYYSTSSNYDEPRIPDPVPDPRDTASTAPF